MVNALKHARRILADGGFLVDARPDSRALARVRRGNPHGPIIGTISTQRETKTDDGHSDAAVREIIRQRRFSSARVGRFWHAMPFEDLAALQRYLDDHLRFSRRVRWRVPRSGRVGRLYLDRPVRFEVLEALSR